MKNIREIIKNDFNAIIHNPTVMLVLLALIIIPSLYSVLNIAACWDMYGNTGELGFAIANLDEGATYDGAKLNVGNDLVKELKNNTDFKWTFVSEKTLKDGVKNGTYYAGIVIPKDFSENIISITSDDPEPGVLEYYGNSKTNPVASKLADSGAKEVYRTMNANIVEFINLAAYGKLGELEDGLSSGVVQLSSGAVQLSNGASQVSSGASQVSSGASQVSSGVSEVSSGASEVNSGASKVSSGASQVSSAASKVSSGSSAVSQGASQVSSGASQVSSGASQVQDSAKQLEQASSQLPDSVKPYAQGAVQIANASSQVASGSNNVAQGSVKLADSAVKLANGAGSVANGASSVADGASSVASGSSKLANGSVALAQGSNELAEGALSLAAGSELLANSAASALFTAASSLSVAAGSLSDITGIDEGQLGDYFYSPIILNKTDTFSVSNFGSQLSPFYIVLSMWIGGIICSVMIKTGYSTNTKYKPLELYLGKLPLYIMMAILQTTVTLIGLFALNVDIGATALFIFSAYLVSIVFMILMYSFVAALGNVGKAFGIILLVLQLSSTGGVYPIELMSSFFQFLYPYMPMTYAITMLRESMLGLYWPNYIRALVILVAFGIGIEILAIVIKSKADDKAHYFENKVKKSGLF